MVGPPQSPLDLDLTGFDVCCLFGVQAGTSQRGGWTLQGRQQSGGRLSGGACLVESEACFLTSHQGSVLLLLWRAGRVKRASPDLQVRFEGAPAVNEPAGDEGRQGDPRLWWWMDGCIRICLVAWWRTTLDGIRVAGLFRSLQTAVPTPPSPPQCSLPHCMPYASCVPVLGGPKAQPITRSRREPKKPRDDPTKQQKKGATLGIEPRTSRIYAWVSP